MVRVFVQPDEPESVQAVLADLEVGAIESFHAFKWRLAMALQKDAEAGVGVHEVWKIWDREGRSALHRAPEARWPEEVVRTIEAYRDLSARLHFPTLGDLRGTLREFFDEQRAVLPTYQLGERCPTLVLSPRLR